jgi:hypothetical protein
MLVLPCPGSSLDRSVFGDLLHRRRLADVAPPVRRHARHQKRRRRDDEIGLAHDPRRAVGKGDRRRQVGAIAFGGAVVGPLRDRRDLLVSEAEILLHGLDADVPLEQPRRHHAAHARHVGELRPLLDGARPGAHFLVGHQRHRRDRVGSMTPHAGSLQNRRDVLAVGDRTIGRRLCGGGQRGADQERGHEDDQDHG